MSRNATEGGLTAEHVPIPAPEAYVAPVLADKEHNTIKNSLVPFACWRANDMRFEFESSFVLPEIGTEVAALMDLMKEHTLPDSNGRPEYKPALTVFGHADPTGSDDFNKNLSGRRAQAIYALLVRKTDLWADLYSNPFGNDRWEPNAIHTMQSTLGQPRSDRPSSSARKALFKAYMDELCTIRDDDRNPILDGTGKPVRFELKPGDFLAAGVDPHGKGDFQGCGEFNPVLMFSRPQNDRFTDPANKDERDAENAPNRRVLIFLFRPGIRTAPDNWPCPRVKEGSEGCRKRFWSDSDERRKFRENERTAAEDQDTFACRFYDRMATNSPCEKNLIFGKKFRLQLCDFTGQIFKNTTYTLKLDGRDMPGTTNDEGFTRLHTCTVSKGALKVRSQSYDLSFDPDLQPSMLHAQSMLNALGFNAGPLDGIKGRRTEDALRAYQRERKLKVTGELDEATQKALRKEHVIKEKSAAPGTPPKAAATSGIVQVKIGDPTVEQVKVGDPKSATGSGTAATLIVKADAESKVVLPPPHNELSQAFFDRFTDIDLDKDGFASKTEIDVALGKADFKGTQGAMLATIKKLLGDFEDFSDDELGIENDGITLADMTEYDRLREKFGPGKSGPAKTMDTLSKIQQMFDFAKSKINNTNKTLFPANPDPMQVMQGMIGDCWFLAAIVAVGNEKFRGPAEIRKWIMTDPADPDKFTVKFPGSDSIAVTRPTDAELAIFATAGSNGLWLPVLEKAYGASVKKGQYFFVDTSVTNAADGGARLGKGLSIITGHDNDTDELFLTSIDTTRLKLTSAFRHNKIATAGINGGIFADFTDDGLPMGHAYTVLSYDVLTDIIKVRNPWGHTGPKGVTVINGAFEMKLPDFDKNFSDIAYEE
jgi:hypothetical protein